MPNDTELELEKRMHTFYLEIAVGNDSMQSPDDVASALEAVAANLRRDARFRGSTDGGIIRDTNGNRVGSHWSEEN